MVKFWVASDVAAGGLVAESEALVSILDHGFTVGDGVFETIKTVKGFPFELERHLARLQNSAALLRLAEPELSLVREAVDAVCDQSKVQQETSGRLRVTWTAGVGPLGSERSTHWTLTVAWAPSKVWPATTDLFIVPIARNEHSPLSGAKTTSYADNALALQIAHDNQASEALLLNVAGDVCECASSNIFIVQDEIIVTPDRSQGCLLGVTRGLVIDMAASAFEVQERRLTLAELFAADEVFVTSSTRDIQPVARINEQRYIAPGKVTQQLQTLFAAYQEERIHG